MSTEKTPSEAYNTLQKYIAYHCPECKIDEICAQVEEILSIEECVQLLELCTRVNANVKSIMSGLARDSLFQALNQRKRMLEKTNAPI